jgi:WS/DGAT/MGAT family acyltransferase
VSTEELTALESSFLWFEQPGRPLHVGAVAVFDGAPLLDARGRLRLADLRRLVDERLDRVPRLRQRIAPGPSPLGRPRWVDDPDFDVAHHVHEIRLPAPGDEATFHRAVEAANAELFDLEHPPWELHFVTGRADGRVGLVERAHHALVDGVGGVDLAAVFLDLQPGGRPGGGRDRRAPRDARRRDAGSPPPGAAAGPGAAGDGDRTGTSVGAWTIVDHLGPWLRGPVGAAGAALAALRHPREAAHGVAEVARGVAALVADGVVTPSASLNVPTGERRRLAWIRVRLDKVKAAGHAAGGTVNDVVLAAVTAGLRSLLVERRVPLDHDMTLKALVPVSERSDEARPSLGNQVSAVLAPLPVGDGDPGRRLASIVAATRRLKASGEATAVGAFLQAADLLPAPVARVVVEGVRHQPFVNLVVTNVPGPPCPLYLMGAEMLDACPVLPLAANLTVGVAILSYNGTLNIGVTADAAACPDLDVLAQGIADGFAALGAT